MDALKKFLNNKKSDKKFKNAGPGHRLTETNPSTSSNVTKVKQPSPKQAREPLSEERSAAAVAALARLEQKKSAVDPNEILSHRQQNFIREQARKEIEAEKKQEAALKENVETGTKSQDSRAGTDAMSIRSENGQNVDPTKFAATGVFYTCPMIGPAVGPREEIENNIYEFLISQLEEDMGVVSSVIIYSCNPEAKIQPCVQTLCKYVENIMSHPAEHKFRKIRCSNKIFQEKVAGVKGAVEFLKASGFVKTLLRVTEDSPVEEEFWVFTPATEEDLEGAVAALAELRTNLISTIPILPEVDRNVQVLMPSQVTTRKELPPEFYQLTGEEVKREQMRRTEVAEKETQLRTKAQREQEARHEQRLYKFCLIRVRFQDGLTLQGTFRSSDKIGDVYAFVKDSLAFTDAVFVLKQPGVNGGDNLSDLEATLSEMRLPPASVLLFQLESTLPVGQESIYLKADLLALVQPLE